jgi:hypothetical protein
VIVQFQTYYLNKVAHFRRQEILISREKIKLYNISIANLIEKQRYVKVRLILMIMFVKKMRQISFKNRRSYCKDSEHRYNTQYNQIKSNKNTSKPKDKLKNWSRKINR